MLEWFCNVFKHRNINHGLPDMDKVKTLELIDHLEGLGNGVIQPELNFIGLCGEVKELFLYQYPLFKKVMGEWPEHSGNLAFPISHNDYGNPLDAYTKTDNLWGDNDYGNARKRLCLYIAKELKKAVYTA